MPTIYRAEPTSAQYLADATTGNKYPLHIWGYVDWTPLQGQGGRVELSDLVIDSEPDWQNIVKQEVARQTKVTEFKQLFLYISTYTPESDLENIKAVKYFPSDYIPDIYIFNRDINPQGKTSVRVWASAESIYIDRFSRKPKHYKMYFENLVCPPTIEGIRDEILRAYRRGNPNAFHANDIFVAIDHIRDPFWKTYEQPAKIAINYANVKDKLLSKYALSRKRKNRKIG